MLASMPRVDAIWANPLFQENLAAIEAAETQRVYCRHGLSHLLDVARTAWIINLEGGFGLARDVSTLRRFYMTSVARLNIPRAFPTMWRASR